MNFSRTFPSLPKPLKLSFSPQHSSSAKQPSKPFPRKTTNNNPPPSQIPATRLFHGHPPPTITTRPAWNPRRRRRKPKGLDCLTVTAAVRYCSRRQAAGRRRDQAAAPQAPRPGSPTSRTGAGACCRLPAIRSGPVSSAGRTPPSQGRRSPARHDPSRDVPEPDRTRETSRPGQTRRPGGAAHTARQEAQAPPPAPQTVSVETRASNALEYPTGIRALSLRSIML